MPEIQYDLDEQLERTVEWVKYAETKNGVLLTLVSALLVAFFQQDVLPVWSFWSNCVCVTLLIEILYLLSSFSPILKISSKCKCMKKMKKKIYVWGRRHALIKPRSRTVINLHYYGSIANVSIELYRFYVKKYYSDCCSNEKHFLDVTNQIKINSDIAIKKFKCFQRTVRLSFATFVLLILAA
jgi:hypothetical protein